MTLLIIYFILNIILIIGVNNEGHIIPKESSKKDKIIFNVLLFLFGVISAFFIIISGISEPFLIRYKWYKRQRKIKKAKFKKTLRERESEPLIRIY